MHELPAGVEAGLPSWAIVTPKRLAHIERVVALLDHWAERLQLAPPERRRWTAAGWLHDALRNATEDQLRSWTDEPGHVSLLHGPAAAAQARADGITDEEVLQAVAWHTVGHAQWGPLGQALYAADFLEPGRPFLGDVRAALAARFPDDHDPVFREIVRLKLAHLGEKGTALHPLTEAFAARWA
ncbi:MAG TPA: HD domain-containing protein [Gemmatimonadales bacterium]|nr:HD domain-containing protein [Gemmatimonadales bacterium]